MSTSNRDHTSLVAPNGTFGHRWASLALIWSGGFADKGVTGTAVGCMASTGAGVSRDAETGVSGGPKGFATYIKAGVALPVGCSTCHL